MDLDIYQRKYSITPSTSLTDLVKQIDEFIKKINWFIDGTREHFRLLKLHPENEIGWGEFPNQLGRVRMIAFRMVEILPLRYPIFNNLKASRLLLDCLRPVQGIEGHSTSRLYSDLMQDLANARNIAHQAVKELKKNKT